MREGAIPAELAGTAQADGACPRPDFRHVEVWIFDLDNTLYPHGSQVLIEAEQRICRFIEKQFGLSPAEAFKLQKDCLREYGSTLSGLVRQYGVEPESYLSFVNDIDVTTLSPAPELARALARLPGRCAVFTNNCSHYTARVLDRLGIADRFETICDIRTIGFAAKPAPASYETVLARLGVLARRSAMFEDSERNLVPAHRIGMTTVWLKTPGGQPAAIPPHVHHHTDDLTDFLHSIEVHSPS
jgi:putative hydrolase of the HAD superfamily